MLILIGKKWKWFPKLYNIKVAYGESKIHQFHTTAEVTNYYVVPYKGISYFAGKTIVSNLNGYLNEYKNVN